MAKLKILCTNWHYILCVVVGTIIILYPFFYWTLFPLCLMGQAKVSCDNGKIIVVSSLYQLPQVIEASEVGSCRVDPIELYLRDTSKGWGCGWCRWPIGQDFLPRLKEFIQAAKAGEKRELKLRPVLQPIRPITLPALLLVGFGIWGFARGPRLKKSIRDEEIHCG